jgi:hypothetical protein
MYTAQLEQELLFAKDACFYLVFTTPCLTVLASTPCQPHSVGETSVLKADGPSFTPDGRQVYWSLGKRITGDIDPTLPGDAREVLSILNYECDESRKLAIQDTLPAVSVNIYARFEQP